MEDICIKIPEDLKELGSTQMINWQLVVGNLLKREFEELSRIKGIIDKSKLTKKQAQQLSDEINTSLAEKYKKLKEG